jgi:hypothetical protein
MSPGWMPPSVGKGDEYFPEAASKDCFILTLKITMNSFAFYLNKKEKYPEVYISSISTHSRDS